MPRLKQRYRDEIAAGLREQFGYDNLMQVPGLVKIVVNMGVGEAARDAKLIDGAVRDLTAITGQKPLVRRASKSIAQFKLREGMPIGAKVTLRGDRMWEFLDRLLSIALPRIRDFRGLSTGAVRRHGNYTFGLTEQSMFHEIDQDRIDRQRGMDITVVTTAGTDDEGRALLQRLGFPFRSTETRNWRGEEGADPQGGRKPKFAVRAYTRCQRCGRPQAVYRKFGLCRICIREMAHRASCPASPRPPGSTTAGTTASPRPAIQRRHLFAVGPAGNRGEKRLTTTMTMTDPIADMLTRLRNANPAYHDTVVMPYSKIKANIAEILKQEGYIAGWSVEEPRGRAGQDARRRPEVRPEPGARLAGIRRVSKPGLRVYAKSTGMPRVLGGLGVAIISTSPGLLTDRQARKRRVGGEVLAYVW